MNKIIRIFWVLCCIWDLNAFVGYVGQYENQETHKKIIVIGDVDDRLEADQELAAQHAFIEFLTQKHNQGWSIVYDGGIDHESVLYREYITIKESFFELITRIQASFMQKFPTEAHSIYNAHKLWGYAHDTLPDNNFIRECARGLNLSDRVKKIDHEPFLLIYFICTLSQFMLPSLSDVSGHPIIQFLMEEELQELKPLLIRYLSIMGLVSDCCWRQLQSAAACRTYSCYGQCKHQLEILRHICTELSLDDFIKWRDCAERKDIARLLLTSLFNMHLLQHIATISGDIVLFIEVSRVDELHMLLYQAGFVLTTPALYDASHRLDISLRYMDTLLSDQHFSLSSDFNSFSSVPELSTIDQFGMWSLHGDERCFFGNPELIFFEKREFLRSLVANSSDFSEELQFLKTLIALNDQQAEELISSVVLCLDPLLMRAYYHQHQQTILELLYVCHQLRSFWLNCPRGLVLDPILFLEDPARQIHRANDVLVQQYLATMDRELLEKWKRMLAESYQNVECVRRFFMLYKEIKKNNIIVPAPTA